MSWAEEELGSADLGDERVNRRLVRLAEDLSANPTASIPQACQGWAETKAAYRFFARKELDWRAILQPHWERTEERMRACPRVLCPQDSTDLDFTTQPTIQGLGRLTYDSQHGMFIHPTLAITPEGVMLGTLDVWMWKREPKGEALFKESIRWVEGYERVAEIAATMPATRLVYMADREGDIRALMERAAELGHPADWLIRLACMTARWTMGASCGPSLIERPSWGKCNLRCLGTGRARRGLSSKRCAWPALSCHLRGASRFR